MSGPLPDAHATASSDGGEHFHRGLGLLDATNLVAGAMIGSGIFIVSQDIAAHVGSPGWLLAVWVITGVMTVTVALAYGELAAMFPAAGGQYIYLKEAYSPLWGFLYGWTLFMVIQSGSIAAVGMAFAKYLGGVGGFEWVGSARWLWHGGDLAGGHVQIGVSTANVVAIAVIVLLTYANAVTLAAGKWVQNVFTAAKLLSLLAVGAVGLLLPQPDAALRQGGFWAAHDGAGPLSGLALLSAVGAAMVGSMFAADAWNNVTFVAGEVRNPRRNVPLSLVLGSGGVVLLYLLVNVAYLNVLPFDQLVGAPEQRVAAAAMGRVLPSGAVIISAIVMVSTFGCLNGMILSGPRLYWAMAQDGLFFEAAGRLSARGRVPAAALWFQALWSSVLTLTGTYNDLLDYVIFAALLFYVMSVVGIFLLRRRAPGLLRPYRAWGYPFAPAGYVLAASTMMVILLLAKPLYTWPGLLIVALGAPVYLLWRRAGARAVVSAPAPDAR